MVFKNTFPAKSEGHKNITCSTSSFFIFRLYHCNSYLYRKHIILEKKYFLKIQGAYILITIETNVRGSQHTCKILFYNTNKRTIQFQHMHRSRFFLEGGSRDNFICKRRGWSPKPISTHFCESKKNEFSGGGGGFGPHPHPPSLDQRM